MTDDTDKLDAKLDELITAKLDAAMTPFLEKLDAFVNKDDETDEKKKKKKKEEGDESKDEKKDAKPLELATEILRTNLKGAIKKEKLDSMSLEELNMAHLLKSELNIGGIRNTIDEKSKTDSKSTDEWGMEFED